MEVSDLTPIYAEFASILDIESAVKIHQHFKGQQIAFPQHLTTSEYQKKQIIKCYEEGMNIRELSREFGFSDRYVRKIISDKKKQNTEGSDK